MSAKPDFSTSLRSLITNLKFDGYHYLFVSDATEIENTQALKKKEICTEMKQNHGDHRNINLINSPHIMKFTSSYETCTFANLARGKVTTFIAPCLRLGCGMEA